ncbi:MAG: dihydrolipoyl dehydrogenase [Muribaculaceae bacterium]|nr:dihydrolipoyl dehydrogenase [Muribaculaceae bacterium]
MKHSDLIIIGAGPGGYETALEAARRGMSVTLFNGDRLGGTCLNEGCIPTKCLCRNAEVVATMKESEKFGIDDFTFSLDFTQVMARKEAVVGQLRDGIAMMLKQAKVEVVDAMARFKSPHVVEAAGEEYEADNIIIATGSDSRSLPIEGSDLDCVMDSTRLLSIDYIPESLTIIGGGVIGMEFASVFASFGSKVTVIEFMKQILPPFDSDIAKRLKQTLSKRGITIVTSAAAKSIVRNDDSTVTVVYESKGKEASVTSTDLLMAVGRAPRVEGLGLENAGVEYSAKGIPVDDNMLTNVGHIYAIGDVNARMMLAHVATFQGYRALSAITSTPDDIDFSIVPSAVFTVPECGMVGKTEEQCKAEGIAIRTGQSFFRANGKALTMAEPDGLCKLIFRESDGLLIGAHIMGIEAADLAQQCADMMNAGATLESMHRIIFSHPSVSEVIMAALHAVK